MLAFND